MTIFISLDVGGSFCHGFGVRWPHGPQVTLEAPSRNLRTILDIELGRLLLTIRDQAASSGLAEPANWLIGAAGGRPERDTRRIANLMQDLGVPFADLVVYRDFEANHAAAFGGEDGLLSVNGTGSVLYGRYKGREARRAGWGYLLDEIPSAGAFGRWALQAILQLQAGTPFSPVWAQLAAKNLPPEATSSASLLDLLYASSSPQKLLAGFSPLFTRAWSESCPWAQARMAGAFDLWAKEMGQLADSLAAPEPKLEPKPESEPESESELEPVPIPFSGLGGLWKDWPDGLALAKAAIHKTFPGRFNYLPPRFAPAWGPLLLHLKPSSPKGLVEGMADVLDQITSLAATARTA